MKVGDVVTIQQNLLRGLRAKVVAIIEDDESTTYRVKLLEKSNFVAYPEGEEIDLHRYELKL